MDFSKIPSNAEVKIREKPMFSFSAISDIHLYNNNTNRGYDDLI